VAQILEDRPATKSQAVVVIGASMGGIEALSTILRDLPVDFPVPIVVVQHRPPRTDSWLVPILQRCTKMPVVEASEGDLLKAGVVYVARADQHATLTDAGRVAYHNGRRVHFLLSSATPLFESAAVIYGVGAIGVVLTGYGRNGTDGVQAIQRHGGIVIAQDKATSKQFGMPGSAIATGAVEYVLPLEDIAPALVRVAKARSGQSGAPAS